MTRVERRLMYRLDSRKKQHVFRLYCYHYGSVRKTCKRAKMTRRNFYYWMRNDPKFAECINLTRATMLKRVTEEKIHASQSNMSSKILTKLDTIKKAEFPLTIKNPQDVRQRLDARKFHDLQVPTHIEILKPSFTLDDNWSIGD